MTAPENRRHEHAECPTCHALDAAVAARDARIAELERELAESIRIEKLEGERVKELEAAITEAAWIICDHPKDCEAIEWAKRRGNWEDKYAVKAFQSGDGGKS